MKGVFMKPTIFLLHHARLGENLYWLSYVKKKLEQSGNWNVVSPLFPDINKQSYKSWKKVFEKYEQLIDDDSVFVGYSTGAIFAIKFLIEKKLNIRKLITVAGFNNFANCQTKLELIKKIDEANKTFFVEDVSPFLGLCQNRVCFFGDNDNFISQEALADFAKKLKAKTIVISGAGHFNKGTKFEKKFDEILDEIGS